MGGRERWVVRFPSYRITGKAWHKKVPTSYALLSLTPPFTTKRVTHTSLQEHVTNQPLGLKCPCENGLDYTGLGTQQEAAFERYFR